MLERDDVVGRDLQDARERGDRALGIGQVLRVDEAELEEDVLERGARLLGARAADERLGGVGPLRVLELQIGERGERLAVRRILRQDRLELGARAIAILELVAGDAREHEVQRLQLARRRSRSARRCW